METTVIEPFVMSGKRHVCMSDNCLSSMTSPAVWSVQMFVADYIAGFMSDNYPAQASRDWAAKSLRLERAAKGSAYLRGIVRLDYNHTKLAIGSNARMRYIREQRRQLWDKSPCDYDVFKAKDTKLVLQAGNL